VQEAKAKLPERARAGEAQVIGARDSCVVVSMEEYKRLTQREEGPRLGKWLVANLSGFGEIEAPSRGVERPVPFADWSDAELGCSSHPARHRGWEPNW